MNERELRDTLRKIQEIVSAETGARLGEIGEKSLTTILRNVATHNLSGVEGFSSRNITILLADLRGFTSICSTYPAGVVLRLLNRCLITMSEIVFQYQGAIDKFMGDSIMVLFDGANSPEDAAKRAVLCAIDMQVAMEELNEHYKQFGFPELYLGVGINTGSVMAGVLGSELYSAYTVIGDEVNLASRIEAFSLRGQVLINQSTYDCCGDLLETGEPIEIHVKGKANPVRLLEVWAVPSMGKHVPRRETRKSPRVATRIPFSYQVIESKVALPQVHHGLTLDVGYHGMLAEIDKQLPASSELKVEFELPLVGAKVADAYARIVKIEKSDTGYLAGFEFTSLSNQDSGYIRRFVQQLIQGGDAK